MRHCFANEYLIVLFLRHRDRRWSRKRFSKMIFKHQHCFKPPLRDLEDELMLLSPVAETLPSPEPDLHHPVLLGPLWNDKWEIPITWICPAAEGFPVLPKCKTGSSSRPGATSKSMAETVCPLRRSEHRSASFHGNHGTVQRTICAAFSPIASLTWPKHKVWQQ